MVPLLSNSAPKESSMVIGDVVNDAEANTDHGNIWRVMDGSPGSKSVAWVKRGGRNLRDLLCSLILVKVGCCNRKKWHAMMQGESDPFIVLCDGSADYMGKGRARWWNQVTKQVSNA